MYFFSESEIIFINVWNIHEEIGRKKKTQSAVSNRNVRTHAFFTLTTSPILNTGLQTENILLQKFTVRKKKGL